MKPGTLRWGRDDMVERTAPGAMTRLIERRAIDDPGAGMLARANAVLDVG